MNIETAIAKLMTANSLNVYPVRIPQNATYPAATYFKVSSRREPGNISDPGLVSCRLQFDIYAATYSECKTFAGTIQGLIQNFQGVMGGAGGCLIDSVEYVNEMDEYEEAIEKYRCIAEYEVWYVE